MFRKEAGCPAPPCSRTVANLFFRKTLCFDGKIEYYGSKKCAAHGVFACHSAGTKREIVHQANLQHKFHLLFGKIIFFAER